MKRWRGLLISILGSIALSPAPGPAQDQPNLSGDWVLVAATTSGPTRAPGSVETRQPGQERPIGSYTVSGAPFNCGRACTIVHKVETLIIDEALLGSDATPAPVVVLHLDGRSASVVDSFNSRLQIPMTAGWNGNEVEIATADGRHRQVIFLDAAQLVVVTTTRIGDAQPVTFRYRRR